MVLALVAAVALPAYQDVSLEGFALRVEADLIENHAPLWSSVRRELENQLYRIARVVPDEPLGKLRKITVWVHREGPWTKCMAYHPGAQFLREHQMNPAMEFGIEVGNSAAFVSWTYEQPWMVLHELAHGFHHQFLENGYDNPVVMEAWKAAMATKKYEDVLRYNGKRERHYACTNQMEYFAEATEAYFGRNDFFPFVQAELREFDLGGYELMRKIWGDPLKRP